MITPRQQPTEQSWCLLHMFKTLTCIRHAGNFTTQVPVTTGKCRSVFVIGLFAISLFSFIHTVCEKYLKP